MKSVCICGAGTMGREIAIAVVSAGIPVIIYDLDQRVLTDASVYIENYFELAALKKKISREEKPGLIRLISYSLKITDCKADLIIEAIIEKISAKIDLFEKLAEINGRNSILATNTSSLSVTAIAGGCKYPEQIIGLHFFNPASRMKLVEVVKTRYTSPDSLEKITGFAALIGKTAVICVDEPGFIVNHVARPFYLEALRIAEKKISDPTTIDALMESAGFKMGPFRLMDLIGNDINYAVSKSLYEQLGRPQRLKPSVIQEMLLENGELGKKTGSGFYKYPKSVSE